MVRKIVWSATAKKSKQDILQYWAKRNKSSVFSKKLNRLITDAINQLARLPNTGKQTSIAHIRVKIVLNYLIFYSHSDGEIRILLIWDGRRNPSELNIDFK